MRALRELAGVNIHGDSWTIRSNRKLADVEIGDVVIFRYPTTDHVALVIDYEDSTALGKEIAPRFLTLEEWNYKECQRTVRKISIFDPNIRGIYHPA